MINCLKMTVLSDNIAREPLESEWGLSILIEADEQKILLDTGSGEVFSRNAERLGIDLGVVDTAVLSHAHYDHADGLDTFFAENTKASFLLRKGSKENCYGTEEDGYKYIGIRRGILEQFSDRIQYVTGVYRITDGIWLVPHRKADYAKIAVRNQLFILQEDQYLPDDFAHEQSLVIEIPKGLVVFNSCSHTGVTNILEDIKEALGREDICAYVGGLHLFKYTDEELDTLCEELKRDHIGQIYTGHCTGDHAFDVLKQALGDGITQFYAGFSCELS